MAVTAVVVEDLGWLKCFFESLKRGKDRPFPSASGKQPLRYPLPQYQRLDHVKKTVVDEMGRE